MRKVRRKRRSLEEEKKEMHSRRVTDRTSLDRRHKKITQRKPARKTK